MSNPTQSAKNADKTVKASDVTVLVVDDEPNLLELVASAVRYEGFNVITSLNGRGAIAAARQNRPDVVILDVMLPDLSGFEVLRKLHEIDEAIPVIFLTARDAVEDRIAGITVGADDYVTKPFNIEELMARVRGCCGGLGSGAKKSMTRASPSAISRSTKRAMRSAAVAMRSSSRPPSSSCCAF